DLADKWAGAAIPEQDELAKASPESRGNAQQSATTTSTPAVADLGEYDRIPVRLPGARRAWLFIPTPFFSSDKQRIKAQIDLLLTEDEE
ncbi:MAG: hypothetical protein QFE16_16840, partial [Pseudomonadota bacterium]|nr:hypothetical protein [Pseudomonadota bacterium]